MAREVTGNYTEKPPQGADFDTVTLTPIRWEVVDSFRTPTGERVTITRDANNSKTTQRILESPDGQISVSVRRNAAKLNLTYINKQRNITRYLEYHFPESSSKQ